MFKVRAVTRCTSTIPGEALINLNIIYVSDIHYDHKQRQKKKTNYHRFDQKSILTFNIKTQIATLTEWFEHSLTFFHCVLSFKTRFDVIFGVSILCSERFFYRQVSLAGHRSQVTGHCFTKTESIPNTFKS